MFQYAKGIQQGTSNGICNDIQCDQEIASITQRFKDNDILQFQRCSNEIIRKKYINSKTTDSEKKNDGIIDCETIDESTLKILRHIHHSKSCHNNECTKHQCFGLKILYEHSIDCKCTDCDVKLYKHKKKKKHIITCLELKKYINHQDHCKLGEKCKIHIALNKGKK